MKQGKKAAVKLAKKDNAKDFTFKLLFLHKKKKTIEIEKVTEGKGYFLNKKALFSSEDRIRKKMEKDFDIFVTYYYGDHILSWLSKNSSNAFKRLGYLDKKEDVQVYNKKAIILVKANLKISGCRGIVARIVVNMDDVLIQKMLEGKEITREELMCKVFPGVGKTNLFGNKKSRIFELEEGKLYIIA